MRTLTPQTWCGCWYLSSYMGTLVALSVSPLLTKAPAEAPPPRPAPGPATPLLAGQHFGSSYILRYLVLFPSTLAPLQIAPSPLLSASTPLALQKVLCQGFCLRIRTARRLQDTPIGVYVSEFPPVEEKMLLMAIPVKPWYC